MFFNEVSPGRGWLQGDLCWQKTWFHQLVGMKIRVHK